MELIRPVTDDLVLCGIICDLILVDFIAAWSISIHVEDHRGASDTWGGQGESNSFFCFLKGRFYWKLHNTAGTQAIVLIMLRDEKRLRGDFKPVLL